MPNLAQAGGTAQLNVVLGDATGTVTGGVTAAQVLPYRTFIGSTLLSGLTYGSGGSVDTKTVTGTGATAGVTCTFAAPANAAAIVSQLNTAFGAGFAALGGVGNGYLVITGKLSGGTALAILGIVAPAVIRRVYTVGVTFQNNDTTNGAWLGPAGVGGTGVPGFYIPPNGGNVTLPPVDVTTLYVYAATGAPVINWIGLDLS